MLDEKIFLTVLKEISIGPEALKKFLSIFNTEISLPNIPMKTMGGQKFWNTLCEIHGWKLQQNMITHHARILNAENVRIAWGTINGMEKALARFVNLKNKY
ncbi:MAG TPA: hypothetical protein VIO64_04175 [Pseudobacteroides sp.]|uniref:hypothetical protein n=1 Tax=Pseudobacteroides sp. TaxID=1968840 RepID=UPI002F91E343